MMSDEDRQLMDRAAHDAGPLVGVELVAFRQGFIAALSRRDKRVAELEAMIAALQLRLKNQATDFKNTLAQL